MALSLAEKLKKAAAARLAETAPAIKDRLDSMDAQALSVDTAPETQQTSSTVEFDRLVRQSNSTVRQFNSTVELDSLADKLGRHIQQPNSTDKLSRQADKKNSTDKLSRQTRQTEFDLHPSQQTGLPIKTQARPPLNSSAQKRLAAYLLDNGEHITNYAVITKESGIPYGSVRSALNKFVTHGWVEKSPWGSGVNRAIRLRPTASFLALAQQNAADKLDSLDRQTNSPVDLGCRIRQTNSTDEFVCRKSPLKIDRLKTLSISLETLQNAWPCLFRAGFGLEQIAQIERMLLEQDKTLERVVQGLDHAEWELSNQTMRDKNDRPVTDPCSWVFRSLVKTGYYRRPKGYISPEEQAAKDAEEEAKAVITARQAAEQAQFEAWKTGLDAADLRKAMQGHPGGPKDAWLRKVWQEQKNAGTGGQ